MMDGETDETVRRILRGHTVAEFMRLAPDKRDDILVARLAEDEPILIDDMEEPYDILRCEYYVGSDDNGKRLAKEAAKVYTVTHFSCACTGCANSCAIMPPMSGPPVQIAPLVSGLLIRDAEINCHVTAPITDDDGDVASAWTRGALEDVFKFVNADRIVLS